MDLPGVAFNHRRVQSRLPVACNNPAAVRRGMKTKNRRSSQRLHNGSILFRYLLFLNVLEAAAGTQCPGISEDGTAGRAPFTSIC